MLEEILAVVLLFGGGTAAALAYSPIGRAWADRIRGRTGTGGEGGSDESGRVLALEHRVAELEERLDFAERLLARARDAERLSPGG